MDKINFRWERRFQITDLFFNGYKYRIYDQATADEIIELARFKPGKAWNKAKETCNEK